MQQTYSSTLLQWLKRQSQTQIVIGQKSISIFILKMYLHDQLVQKSTYSLKSKTSYPSLLDDLKEFCIIEPTNEKNDDKLFSQLTLVDQDDIFDTICIRGDLTKIVQLLIDCSHGKAFKEQLKVIQDNKQYIVQTGQWFTNQQQHTCLEWIISEFEKQITLIYYKHVNYVNHEGLMQHWITNKQRNKMLNQIPQILKKNHDIILYSQMIGNNYADFKQITQKFQNNELEDIFYLPIQNALQKQSYCEKLVLKCIREQYKQSILNEFEVIIQSDQKSQQKKKKKKQNKQKKLLNQVIKESQCDVTNSSDEHQSQSFSEDNEDTQEWITITSKKQQRNVHRTFIKDQIQDTSQINKQENIFFPQENIKNNQMELEQSNFQIQTCNLNEEQSNSNQSSAKKVKKNLVIRKQEEPIEQIDSQIMEQSFSSMIKKLDMDMKELNDSILKEQDEFLQIRQLIFNRLQYIITSLFPDSSIHLFGSCLTGLALVDSDIDVGITGMDQCQFVKKMEQIIEYLSRMQWIKKIKPIFPTINTLPLIKVIVDPSIPMNGPFNLHCDSQSIQVDISFFGHHQHLGMISTDYTCYWLQQYHELRPITFLFKSLLKKRGLNDQSKGGISSFCIVLMIVCFLEYFYQTNQQYHSLGYTTYKFLEFYGILFNPSTTGLYYKGYEHNPFIEIDNQDLQITIVSPINQEIISQSSSFVQTILQDIRQLFQSCQNETQFFYEKLKYGRRKKGKKEDRNLFFKELSKLNPLFST